MIMFVLYFRPHYTDLIIPFQLYELMIVFVSYLRPHHTALIFVFQLYELMQYITIMIVFVLGYGIACQSIMFPIREAQWSILKDIFYYPYWQIYGEVFLEEMEGLCVAHFCVRVLKMRILLPYVRLYTEGLVMVRLIHYSAFLASKVM